MHKSWSTLLRLWSLLLLLSSGCATNPVPPPASDAAISELNLLAMPVAVNLNGLPGADGFSVKVFASSADDPKPVPIRKGTVEILLFDGLLSQNKESKPLHVWTFAASELRGYQVQSSIGTGYYFTLQWGKDAPSQNRITVLARYRSPKGRVLYAAPSPITVAPR